MVLPDPEEPTRAVDVFIGISNLRPCRTLAVGRDGYVNVREENLIGPEENFLVSAVSS